MVSDAAAPAAAAASAILAALATKPPAPQLDGRAPSGGADATRTARCRLGAVAPLQEEALLRAPPLADPEQLLLVDARLECAPADEGGSSLSQTLYESRVPCEDAGRHGAVAGASDLLAAPRSMTEDRADWVRVVQLHTCMWPGSRSRAQPGAVAGMAAAAESSSGAVAP